MIREQITKMLSVFMAFAEGRFIQHKKGDDWIDTDKLSVNDDINPSEWRVKPVAGNVVSCGISINGSLMRCKFDRKGICLAKFGKGIKCVNQVKRPTPQEQDRNKKIVIEYGL